MIAAAEESRKGPHALQRPSRREMTPPMFKEGSGGRPLSMRVGRFGVATCLLCGKTFERHDGQQVWCSPRCRSRGGNARWLAVAWKRRRLRKRQRLRAMEPGPVRDAILASKRAWNRRNREYMRAYQRAWRARRRAARSTMVDAKNAPGRIGA